MALVLANRVQETGTANTTVSFTLAGAVTGFQSFSTIGNGNTTYYSATDASGNWEVGLGTYSTTGPTLTRTAVYASSNTGSAVTFSGTVNVFVTYPSGQGVNLDASGNVSALGTVSSGTWQGSTVGVAYGGTGVTASTGANSVVLRDANENITINRLNQGLQTITASGGVTALTAASDFNQALVGTGGHTYSLPDATTLSDTTAFQFNNNATGTLTITDYASAPIGTIAPGGAAGIALLSNATVGGTWDVHAYIPENVTWGTNALALGTTVITGGTWNGGTIQSGYGGTGLTTFASANNALYSTSASALAAGTLPVAAGGTGLTSYTLNGVVYASGTGTLATGSALTFDGTNLINTGAYTAPSNGSGAGTKTTIQGSTGTGQAGTSGGNGFIELVGGGGTSTWTAFNIANARRRGGINLQAGTAQADAGGTYVNGSTINITGSSGTNNGATVGFGSNITITAGAAIKTDSSSNAGALLSLSGASSTAGGGGQLQGGAYNFSTYSNYGSRFLASSASSAGGGTAEMSSGSYTTLVSGSTQTNNASYIQITGSSATSSGDINLVTGAANITGSTRGKVQADGSEILTVGNIFNTTLTTYWPNGVVYVSSTGVLTSQSALTFDGSTLSAVNSSNGATTEVLRLSNNGTGGGTQAQLTFYAASTNYAQITGGYSTAPNLTTNVDGGGYQEWQISGVTIAHLDGIGLGILTSTPVTELDVAGSINLTGQIYCSDVGGIYFSGPYNFYAGISAANSGFDLVIQAGGGTEQARFTATGLVVAATAAITSARINPRVSTSSSTASITPDIQANDQYNVTALATSLTINAPTGTPVDGNKLLFRILDNGTPQSLSWNATYTAIGTALPSTTTANKTTYVGCIYNANNTRWDVIAVTTQA